MIALLVFAAVGTSTTVSAEDVYARALDAAEIASIALAQRDEARALVTSAESRIEVLKAELERVEDAAATNLVAAEANAVRFRRAESRLRETADGRRRERLWWLVGVLAAGTAGLVAGFVVAK